MTNQLIFKRSCWNCKKTREDPHEQYLCPQWKNHWEEMMALVEKTSFEL